MPETATNLPSAGCLGSSQMLRTYLILNRLGRSKTKGGGTMTVKSWLYNLLTKTLTVHASRVMLSMRVRTAVRFYT